MFCINQNYDYKNLIDPNYGKCQRLKIVNFNNKYSDIFNHLESKTVCHLPLPLLLNEVYNHVYEPYMDSQYYYLFHTHLTTSDNLIKTMNDIIKYLCELFDEKTKAINNKLKNIDTNNLIHDFMDEYNKYITGKNNLRKVLTYMNNQIKFINDNDYCIVDTLSSYYMFINVIHQQYQDKFGYTKYLYNLFGGLISTGKYTAIIDIIKISNFYTRFAKYLERKNQTEKLLKTSDESLDVYDTSYFTDFMKDIGNDINVINIINEKINMSILHLYNTLDNNILKLVHNIISIINVMDVKSIFEIKYIYNLKQRLLNIFYRGDTVDITKTKKILGVEINIAFIFTSVEFKNTLIKMIDDIYIGQVTYGIYSQVECLFTGDRYKEIDPKKLNRGLFHVVPLSTKWGYSPSLAVLHPKVDVFFNMYKYCYSDIFQHRKLTCNPEESAATIIMKFESGTYEIILNLLQLSILFMLEKCEFNAYQIKDSLNINNVTLTNVLRSLLQSKLIRRKEGKLTDMSVPFYMNTEFKSESNKILLFMKYTNELEQKQQIMIRNKLVKIIHDAKQFISLTEINKLMDNVDKDEIKKIIDNLPMIRKEIVNEKTVYIYDESDDESSNDEENNNKTNIDETKVELTKTVVDHSSGEMITNMIEQNVELTKTVVDHSSGEMITNIIEQNVELTKTVVDHSSDEIFKNISEQNVFDHSSDKMIKNISEQNIELTKTVVDHSSDEMIKNIIEQKDEKDDMN